MEAIGSIYIIQSSELEMKHFYEILNAEKILKFLCWSFIVKGVALIPGYILYV